MKNLLPVLALVATLNAVQAQTSSDTAAIHRVLKDEAEGWIKGDAVTYSRHFADEGTFANIMGMFFTGHETFLKRHARFLKGCLAIPTSISPSFLFVLSVLMLQWWRPLPLSRDFPGLHFLHLSM